MKIKDYKCKCGSDEFFMNTKGNQTGIYCDKCGKWLKWADHDEKNLLFKVDFLSVIPNNATNGDVIKVTFPYSDIVYHEKGDLVDAYVTVFIDDSDTCQDYSLDWWNAPYKRGEEDESDN